MQELKTNSKRTSIGFFILALTFLSALTVQARPWRPDKIPSNAVGEGACGACHFNPNGGGARNVFGVSTGCTSQTCGQNDEFWGDMADLDPDGDGYTNGEELGDPDGTWVSGDDNTIALSNPAEADDTPCGNGSLEGPEVCDGNELDGASCISEGFDEGTLACSDTCTFDTSACVSSCGNGIVDTDEDCDGLELDEFTCSSLGEGFSGGDLGCTTACAFDTSACIPEGCGNGTIDGDEACDDGDDNSNTDADACRVNCQEASCGDDVVDSGEECDGDDDCSVDCLTINTPAPNTPNSGNDTVDDSGCNAAGGASMLLLLLGFFTPRSFKRFN